MSAAPGVTHSASLPVCPPPRENAGDEAGRSPQRGQPCPVLERLGSAYVRSVVWCGVVWCGVVWGLDCTPPVNINTTAQSLPRPRTPLTSALRAQWSEMATSQAVSEGGSDHLTSFILFRPRPRILSVCAEPACERVESCDTETVQ